MRRLDLVVIAGSLIALTASMAPAAVLCQRKAKLRIRPDACTPKETLVQDLAALGVTIDTLAANAASTASDADNLERDFALSCVGAPTRTLAPSPLSFYHELRDCLGGCRAHDGNQAACESSYALSNDGATSCHFFDGFCVPCNDCGNRGTDCVNACLPVPNVTCAGDPSRTTVFAGRDACSIHTTEAACDAAYHLSRRGTVDSCHWDGSTCRGCGPSNEADGDCTDACSPASCADSTRTTVARCRSFSDEPTCNKAFHPASASGGTGASCWWDPVANGCLGCGFPHELAGHCTNTCRP